MQTGAGIPLAVAVNMIIIMLTGRAPEQTRIDFGSLYTVFLLLVFAPAVEEFLFRKLTIDRLRRFGKYPAVIVSAVMFAVPHIFSQGAQACAMTLVAGLVWGYIYYRTDKLLPCVVMHALFNVINGYLASFLTTRGGIFMALYFLIYVIALPITALIILVRGGGRIFGRE